MDWPEKCLEKLDKEIGEMKTDLRGVNQRIDAVNERIDTVISTVNQRFDATDQKIDSNHNWIVALVIGTLASFTALIVTIWFAR